MFRDAHKSMYVSECILYHTGTHDLLLSIFFIKLVFWGHPIKICSPKKNSKDLVKFCFIYMTVLLKKLVEESEFPVLSPPFKNKSSPLLGKLLAPLWANTVTAFL